MAHTRLVYHTVEQPVGGGPQAGFVLHFRVTPSVILAHATLPEGTAEVVTDDAGYFAVELETGVQYEVTLTSALVKRGAVTNYGRGNVLTLVVPEGDTPIDLYEVAALNNQPIPAPQAADIIAAWLAEQAEALEAVAAGTVPTGGTAGQVLVKASEDDYDTAWGDATAGGGAVDSVNGQTGVVVLDADDIDDAATEHRFVSADDLSKLGGIAEGATANSSDAGLLSRANHTGTQDISTVTGLQSALDDKAATSTLGTAAAEDVGAFAAASHAHAVADIEAEGTADDTTYLRGDGEWATPAGGGGVELAGDGEAATASRSDHGHMTPDTTTSMAIGLGASTGATTGTQNRTAVGVDAVANNANATAIGRSASAGNEAIAIGRSANATGTQSMAIGGSASAPSVNSTAIGRSASATGAQATAIGRSASAGGARRIAIGSDATSDTNDTAVIRANDLKTQRSNGTGATRLALTSPDGTEWWLSIDDSGELTVTLAT